MYAIMYNYANYVQKDFSIQFYTVLYTFWSMAAWHAKTHAVLCTRYSKLYTNLALVFYIMYTICRIMYIIWPRRPQKPSNFVKLCRLWKAVFCFMPFYVTPFTSGVSTELVICDLWAVACMVHYSTKLWCMVSTCFSESSQDAMPATTAGAKNHHLFNSRHWLASVITCLAGVT